MLKVILWRHLWPLPVVVVQTNKTTTAVLQRITVFIEEMNSWLSASRLRLNPAKTEVMWLGSGQQINQVDVSDILILSSSVKVVESARDLGVIIDSQLSLSSHVAALCRSGFYQLRQLRLLCRPLPAEASKTLVQAFISCRLDYCNSLLYGVTDKLMRQYSRCRMLRQGWSQERNVANTSHRYCVNFIGFVAGQTTSWIQDGQLGIPSAVKQSTWLSGRRYSSRLRKFCSLPQVIVGEKVLCHSCSQSFWWQMFCCSWTTYLEQLTCQSARQGSQLHRIQKTTENIHVSDGLRRIVTFWIIAPYKYSYLLTYLLN